MVLPPAPAVAIGLEPVAPVAFSPEPVGPVASLPESVATVACSRPHCNVASEEGEYDNVGACSILITVTNPHSSSVNWRGSGASDDERVMEVEPSSEDSSEPSLVCVKVATRRRKP